VDKIIKGKRWDERKTGTTGSASGFSIALAEIKDTKMKYVWPRL